ncbi:nucleolar protein 8 isoform X1 [Silurus meridionalis]|nr:nucleolar protein 8 isoform X1 [Silurus meridionalis]
MKRLYIGGLSHTISQKDLRDRFGKFGEVSDVEIITRKDEHGSPLKTFAYINLTISDSDYKRCVTVLNKSKWKGGTLQIELAKESFLQRLAKERQQAAEKTHTPKTDVKEKIVESFIAAGVENFHMKAAVPGTEIPGHKDWVVSKFGRVLPIVHLKCQGKTKISFSIDASLKYDPSKHCHNIKKLESEDCFTPVSELTWQIDGGDDEISKRRRGEFPRQKKRPKKTIQSLDPSTNPYSTTIPERWTTGQNRDASQLLQSRKPAVCVFNSDCDSEDEIRTLVAQELSQNHEMVTIEDEGNLEVVSDDFVVKSNMFWGSGETDMVGQIGLKSTRNDEDYDSADTDEILRQNKNSDKTEETEKSNKSLVKSKKIDGKKLALSNNQTPTDSESDNGSESSSESGDSDYEAMMGSCHRLELSLADLENLVKKMEDDESSDDDTNAGTSELPERSSVHEREPQRAQSKKSGINPEDILASLFEPDEDKEEKKEKVMSKKKSCLPAFVGTKDLFGSAAKITGLKRAAEKVNCEFGEEPKRLKSGLKTLEDEESSSEQVPELNKKDTNVSMDCSSEDMMINEEPIKLNSKPSSSLKVNDRTCPELTKTTSLRQSKHSARSSSSGEEEEDEETVPLEPKTSKEHERSASDSSGCSEESDTSSDEEEEESTKREAASEPKQINSSALGPKQFQQTVLDPVKQQQDNQKRLAALEQRQKESEQQKQLIQGALSKVDLPNANKGKHIVFDSDDEVSNDRENTTQQKASLFDEESDDDASGSEEKQDLKEKELKRAGGSKLFDSSEDEDDGTDEGHFKIKPQFEGRAGQKLMELQSRFGTDPRFQMDAKFLESEEQEEGTFQLCITIHRVRLMQRLKPKRTQHKKKGLFSTANFRVLFRVNAPLIISCFYIQSKAARRKKREEAAKLPECSKDIYYDVTTDLKEAFGTVKEIQTENKQVSWDQDDNDDDDNDDDDDDDEDGQAPQADMPALSSSTNQESEPSSGFKFSFFGDDDVTKAQTTDEYKVETIKGAKVAWQVDPRFQDSSSEEEEEEKEEEKEGKKEAAVVTTSKQPVPTKKFFFFFDDDIRLKGVPQEAQRRQKASEDDDKKLKHHNALPYVAY